MRGTPEGRRLFAGCVAGGLALGTLAGIGAGLAFRSDAEVVPCHPEDPNDFRTCREVDVAGFALRSAWGAAFTVGALVALIGWVVCVVFVLYSTSSHPHHHPEPDERDHWRRRP